MCMQLPSSGGFFFLFSFSFFFLFFLSFILSEALEKVFRQENIYL